MEETRVQDVYQGVPEVATSWLKVGEAAARANRVNSCIYLWAKQGHIDTRTMDGITYFGRESLDAWILRAGPGRKNKNTPKRAYKPRVHGLAAIEANLANIEKLVGENRTLIEAFRREVADEVRRELAAKMKEALA